VIYDEHGHSWRVKGGDPAARLTNKLGRMNYRLIVLPLVTLATGTVSVPQAEPADPIHRVRLLDCLAALERG